jgi:phosphohistidine phosphatase
VLLLLVRHAIAEDRVAFARTGQPDDQRPLSSEGRKKMRLVSEALRDLLPSPDLLVSSPLVRARQTAQVLAAAVDLQIVECPALAPSGEPAQVFHFLAGRRGARTVIAVGHEPGLSQLAGFALTGRAQALFSLKKGAACLLDVAPAWRGGAATLVWMLTPAQLRALAPA